MPGLNRRGPMNEGSMTGKGRGLCTGSVDQGQAFGAGGYGSMRRGFGRRRCQAYESGIGWGINYNFRPTQLNTKAVLQNRANLLEAEIAEIKQQLSRMSESSES
jgi:hypothetical protein